MNRPIDNGSGSLRVIVVNLAHAVELEAPGSVLDEYRSLTGWAEGMAAAGAEVKVVQGFDRAANEDRNGIRYQFVAGSYAPGLPRWRIPLGMLRAVRGLRPDVVHLNGLLYHLQARLLRAVLPSRCALVAQHHAEPPARGLEGLVQSWGLRAIDGFLFTGHEMAEPWRRRGLIRSHQPVFEIVEGSSTLAVLDRRTARDATGMRGDPVCIWLANLDGNKDPLTVLAGFETLLTSRPRARLYMAYRQGDLLSEVAERIGASALLSGAVTLLGPLPYEALEVHLNSADLFLQGSHHEGSGYALLDAMACGVVPVVTDIPSFRFITGNRCGVLWTPGDARSLGSAISQVLRQPLELQRELTRALFDDRLSFAVIGRQAVAAYRELLQRRAVFR